MTQTKLHAPVMNVHNVIAVFLRRSGSKLNLFKECGSALKQYKPLSFSGSGPGVLKEMGYQEKFMNRLVQ